jgi:hypothetical protein
MFLNWGLDPCRAEGWRPLTEEFQNQEELDEYGYPNFQLARRSDRPTPWLGSTEE